VTAVGYTSGDPSKVSRSGDTMTGDLALLGAADLSIQSDAAVDGQLDVGGIILADFNNITNINLMRLVAMGLSTAVTSGGTITPNGGDPTKVDIAATTGYIVDYDPSSPLTATNPGLTYVSIPAQVAITPASNPSIYLLDSTGALVQQVSPPTPTQRRTHIFLGVTSQDGGGVVVLYRTLPTVLSQPENLLADLLISLGPFNASGNQLSANGANLMFDKTVGDLFQRSINYTTYQNPNHAVLAAQSPTQFRHLTALAGSAGALTTTLDVANYDPGGAGIVTPVGGGVNTATNFRVYGFGNPAITDQVFVQYGQNTYASLTAALAGLGAGTYTANPAITGGVLLGWITAIRSATDLSDTGEAVFTRASTFSTP